VQNVDDSVTVIHEESKYLSCDVNNNFHWREEYSNPFIVLDAQMGKGKTQFIKNFLNMKKKSNPTILVISQRKSFTHFICDELKEYVSNRTLILKWIMIATVVFVYKLSLYTKLALE
jgi:hypothetical protein